MNYAYVFVLAVFAGIGSVVMRWGGSQAGAFNGIVDGVMQLRWWLVGLGVSWLCGLGYAVSLTRLNLSVAVSIYTGMGYVVAVLGSLFFLHEPLAGKQLIGCGCVVLGLVLLQK
jgi:multidrug transporter EmrE-like cation transporter